MASSGFETLVVFEPKRSESGFEKEFPESDLTDSTDEQQSARDDECMEAESIHRGSDAAVAPQPGGIHLESWSVPESSIFTEAVLSNPSFLNTLKADEILHLKHVCKSWATWFRSSTDAIVQVRRHDESFDWYFPVLYRLGVPAPLFSWTWSGIWHGTAEHLLETQPRPLPSLDCVPRIWRKWRHPETVAMAGGLLLIRFVRDTVNVRVKTHRCERDPSESKGFRFRYCSYCTKNERGSCPKCVKRDNQNWEPLMVVNPLTQAVRILPAPGRDCSGIGEWDIWRYRHMQVLMRVDDEANSYEVILLYNDWMYVYSSTSERWKGLEFKQDGPWRQDWQNHQWGYNWANAWVGRHLFIADMRYPEAADDIRNPLTNGVLQLFEIDVEAGDWKLCTSLLLQKITYSIPIPDVTGYHRDEDVDDLIVIRNLELVECMGHIYAVIPARIDEFLQPLQEDNDTGNLPPQPMHRSNYSPLHPKYMPVQFFIFQLQGDNLLNGVLRIELPEPNAAGWDYKSRRQTLFDKTEQNDHGLYRPQWFSCVGKGSVIWVSCEDYLLQYDVVSGQTRTQVIPVNRVEENMRFAYRPSFHMRP